MRWLALVTGAVLVTVAFLSGARVADTRDGLVYEVIALLAGLLGVGLILYGWVAASIRRRAPGPRTSRTPPAVQVRSANELLAGAVGLLIAAALVIGIALTTGVLWALMGFVLLLPMVLGSGYLCTRFFRAPQRRWKIDLQLPNHHR